MPPLSKEYRNFASAAKEAGFNKTERKLIGSDSDSLLEGVSEKFRDSLTVDMFVSFFSALQKDDLADAKQVLAIGNFLYEFRPDQRKYVVEKKHPLDALTEKELRLVSLACKLVENAFYQGKLLNLPSEQAASLAFTVNVLAKILEDNSANEKLNSFSQKKLCEFIEGVAHYEQQKLSPEAVGEQAVEGQRKKIIEKLEQAERLKPANGWLEYFKDLPDKLDDASGILERSPEVVIRGGRRASGILSLGEIIKWLRSELPEVIKYYEKITSEISKIAKADFTPSANLVNLYDGLGWSLSERLPNAGRFAEGVSKEYILERVRDVRDMHRYSKNQVESLEPADKKTKVKSFNEIGKLTIAIQLPEAVKTLGIIADDEPEGIWGNYLDVYKQVVKMLMKAEKAKKADVMFSNAQKRLREQIENEKLVTAPYLIKSCLIADNMTGLGLSLTDKQRADSEEALMRLEYPFDYSMAGGPLEHSFSVRKKGKSDEGPGYADFHFIPQDMPFAVWALRYLRFRVEARSKNKNSEKPV